MKTAFLALLLALPGPNGGPGFEGAGANVPVAGARLQLRVDRGRVVVERPPGPGQEDSPLTRRAGEVPFDLPTEVHLSAPALSELELSWLGQGSVRVQGASDLWIEAGPGVRLERFRSTEVEVRRGTLRVEVADVCSFEITRAALGLRSSANGCLDLVHRGGAPVEVECVGRGRSTRLRAGERLRLSSTPSRP